MHALQCMTDWIYILESVYMCMLSRILPPQNLPSVYVNTLVCVYVSVCTGTPLVRLQDGLNVSYAAHEANTATHILRALLGLLITTCGVTWEYLKLRTDVWIVHRRALRHPGLL